MDLREKVIEQIKMVYDPELPVNVYDLGLIYDIMISGSGNVSINMTLTSPNCPVAGTLPREVENRVESIPEVKSAKVSIVFDPPWNRDNLSDAAKLELGLF